MPIPTPIRRMLPVSLGLCVVAASVGCVVDLEGRQATETDERVFDVSGTPDIDLSTFDGPIEILGWDRPDVRIEIEKRAADDQALDEIEIEVEQDGDRIRVSARRPDRAGRVTFAVITSWRGVKLTANVPREANVTASTDDGSVTVEGVSGRLELSSDDGSIRGEMLGGQVIASTDDGSVRLRDVSGRVDAQTDDGSMRVSGRLSGVRLRTDDGSVEVGADRDSVMAEDWEIHTDDGSVTLELPRRFSAEFDARTGDGRVRVADEFGGGSARGSDDDDDDGRSTLRRRLNDGGYTLLVRSGDGTIRVRESS